MYHKFTDEMKKQYINEEYVVKLRSFQDIAKELGVYPNKIRRDAIKFDIPIRNKKEAQINAINSGRHSHPTKGKKRSDGTKQKIGDGVMGAWSKLSKDQLEARKNNARIRWKNLSDDKKDEILTLANRAVRRSSKEGSKLEKFLLSNLLNDGYKVEFHKEHILANSKLQIDIFIPKINIAIEVDGPSHFENIWGDDALSRNTKYDQKKQGLLVGKGIKLIRIKQTMDFSPSRAKALYEKLKIILNDLNRIDSINIIDY